MIAVTKIIHGVGDGKEDKVFEPGQTVSGLDDKVMKELEAAGSIVKDKDVDDLSPEEKAAKVAELQRKIAELTATETPVTPGQAAEDLAKESAINAGLVKDKAVDQSQSSGASNTASTSSTASSTPAAK